MQPELLYPRRSRFAPKLCFADLLLKSIILYIKPVLHGCQCFILNPQGNVKVDSKPAVMKYPFETCKISFVLNLGFRFELLFIFLLGPLQIPFFVTPSDGLPLIVSAFTFGNCNGHFGLSVLEINP